MQQLLTLFSRFSLNPPQTGPPPLQIPSTVLGKGTIIRFVPNYSGASTVVMRNLVHRQIRSPAKYGPAAGTGVFVRLALSHTPQKNFSFYFRSNYHPRAIETVPISQSI